MNLLRKIRRQRLVDHAYSNGYEQGRYEALLSMPGRTAHHNADDGCEVCVIWEASEREKEVRAIVAAELRAAADWGESRTGIAQWGPYLRDRAESLDP